MSNSIKVRIQRGVIRSKILYQIEFPLADLQVERKISGEILVKRLIA